MRIYTNISFAWDEELQQYVEESSEYYEYKGEVARAAGGGGQSDTRASAAPWLSQQPYLQELFQQASELNQQGAPDVSRSTASGQAAIDSLNALAGAPTTGGVGTVASPGAVPVGTGTGVPGTDSAGPAAGTPGAGGIQPFLTSALQANQFLTSGDVLNPGSNPALQQYIDLSNQAISRQYTEGILPQIAGSAAASGNIGSSRQGIAEGLGAGRTLDAVQRNTAQLANQGYQSGLDAYVAGVGLAPTTAGLQTLPADLLLASSQAQRGLEFDQYNTERGRIQDFQSVIGGTGFGAETTTTTTGGGTSPAQGALAGAAAGASVGGPYGAAAGAVLGYMMAR